MYAQAHSGYLHCHRNRTSARTQDVRRSSLEHFTKFPTINKAIAKGLMDHVHILHID